MLESSFPVSLPSSHGPLCSMDGDFIGSYVTQALPITLLSISVFLTYLSFPFPFLQLLSPLLIHSHKFTCFKKVLEISLARGSSKKKQPKSLPQASMALNGFCVIIHFQVLPVVKL